MVRWSTLKSTDGVGHDWMDFNKINMPINEFKYTIEDIDKFNEYLRWCRKHLLEVEPTPSGAMPGGKYKFHSRYCVVVGKNNAIELLVALDGRHYRLVIAATFRDDNPMTGGLALKEWWKAVKQFNLLDVVNEYALPKDDALEVKSSIKSAHVKVLCSSYALGVDDEHVYHMDMNSSYGSRICEADERFRPMYEYFYKLRNQNINGYDELYKFVMNASIGTMQSQYCFDEKHKRKPYMLTQLAKFAVDGTYNIIDEYIQKLRKFGAVPLLSNTDGIWYYSDRGAYHDNREGDGLGMWKTDHKDVLFTMKSPGVYQYMEDGKVVTVMRGLCNLDRIKKREDFEWRDIYKTDVDFLHTEYNKDTGVIEYYESQY